MTYQLVDIGELTKIRTGKLDANASSANGEYPFFTCSKKPLKIDNYTYDCEAILVAGNGDLNVKHYKGKFEAYQRTYIIEVTQLDRLDSRYLFYFMDKYVEKLRKLSIGGVIKYIKLGMLTKAKIPLPPLPEQRRIATILDKADAIRRKRQQAIRLTEEFLRSVFLDMFGDPVTYPKGWEVVPLGEIGLVQGGLQVTSKRSGNPIEVPYLRVANVFRDRLNLNEIKTIQVTKAELERIRLQSGDMLMVEGHGNPTEIGRSAIWDGSINDCVHQNHLIRVRVDKKHAYPEYVSTYLNSPGGRRQLFRHGKTTSGLNTISTSNVKNTSIVLPNLAAQKRFLEISEKVKKIAKKMDGSSEIDNAMFNSLVQSAFRGDL